MHRSRVCGLALAAALVHGCGTSAPYDPPPRPSTVDLEVDAGAITSSADLVEVTFDPADCEVMEGAVRLSGLRRLLRFDTVVRNLGDLPLVVGDPADPEPPLVAADFELDPCHGHFHFRGFASYELRRPDGTLLAVGHKQSFCIVDSFVAAPGAGSRTFTCDFQGISVGWADQYAKGVPGQWIDVSGVPGGDYEIVVVVNPDGKLVEADDRLPNQAVVPFHLPDPSVAVAQLDDHADGPDAATEMPFPAGFEAALRPDGDVDWFRVVLPPGVRTIRTELDTLPDGRLRVFDASGTLLLDSNDDVSPGIDLSSRVDRSPLADEEVTIEVSGPPGAAGVYRLVVQ